MEGVTTEGKNDRREWGDSWTKLKSACGVWSGSRKPLRGDGIMADFVIYRTMPFWQCVSSGEGGPLGDGQKVKGKRERWKRGFFSLRLRCAWTLVCRGI